MATRKRAKTDEGETKLNADNLAEFIGFDGDSDKLSKAIELSCAAAESFTGRPVPAEMGHNLSQGIKLLATKLLLIDKLDEAPEQQDIPLVVRYYFRLAADAGR